MTRCAQRRAGEVMAVAQAFSACVPASDPRVEARRLVREALGVCACGTPIVWHFSDDNDFLPCAHPDVIAGRLHRVLEEIRSANERSTAVISEARGAIADAMSECDRVLAGLRELEARR